MNAPKIMITRRTVAGLMLCLVGVGAGGCPLPESASGDAETQPSDRGDARVESMLPESASRDAGTQSWASPPGWTLGNMAAASRGSEGAIAYVEYLAGYPRPQRSRVMFQRIDDLGARVGTAIELGTTEEGWLYGRPALATDGHRYLVCWTFKQITCVSVSPGEDRASPAFQREGGPPTLAYRAGTWVLAYTAPPATLGHGAVIALQRLGAAFEFTESPVAFPLGGFHDSGTPLAATESGFVLVYGSPARLEWLDGDLKRTGAAISLGVASALLWSGSLAATDAVAAVSLRVPYGNHLLLVDHRSVTAKVDTEGGGKPGQPVAIIANGSSFEMAWFGDHPEVQYQTVGGARLAQDLKAVQQIPAEGPILTRVGPEVIIVAMAKTMSGSEVRTSRVRR